MGQYCGQCGTEIPDHPSFKFCEKCGFPVVKATSVKVPSATPGKKALLSSEVLATKKPKKNRLYLIIGIWIFIIIFLALISSLTSGNTSQVIKNTPFVTTSYTNPPAITQSHYSVTPVITPSRITPVTFTGTYQGYFVYDNSAIQYPFTISMQQSGSKLTGMIREQSKDSGTASEFLDSTLQGTVSGNSMNYVKTYKSDNHQVTYSGQYNSGTKQIVGRWYTGSTVGSFTIYLIR